MKKSVWSKVGVEEPYAKVAIGSEMVFGTRMQFALYTMVKVLS